MDLPFSQIPKKLLIFNNLSAASTQTSAWIPTTDFVRYAVQFIVENGTGTNGTLSFQTTNSTDLSNPAVFGTIANISITSGNQSGFRNVGISNIGLYARMIWTPSAGTGGNIRLYLVQNRRTKNYLNDAYFYTLVNNGLITSNFTSVPINFTEGKTITTQMDYRNATTAGTVGTLILEATNDDPTGSSPTYTTITSSTVTTASPQVTMQVNSALFGSTIRLRWVPGAGALSGTYILNTLIRNIPGNAAT